MHTYLFYDLETSGLNKCFDQVLQFAAIRTDLAFNELERYETLIRVAPTVVPAPRAVLTHRLTPRACESGLSELEGMRRIHDMINTQGTISLGYNTLRFDDEFLRFSFYRNLLQPYTHQYANNCQRMDIYPMTVMYRLFKPEVLQWMQIEGRSSLRLEDINTANQLAEGAAHDALVDVEITIALAKILAKETEMWTYLSGFYEKQKDLGRMRECPVAFRHSERPLRYGLLIDSSFGERNQYMVPVLWLGQHYHYHHQVLLRLDLQALQEVSFDNVDEKTWAIRKKPGEPGFLLPPKERYSSVINGERNQLMAANLAWLENNPALLDEIIQYHLDYCYPVIPRLDLDAALYDNGFWSDEDLKWCTQFHALQAGERQAWLQQVPNPLLYELGIRILGKQDPDMLNDDQKLIFDDYRRQVAEENPELQHRDFKNQTRLSPRECLQEAQQLLASEENKDNSALLSELVSYIEETFPQVSGNVSVS